MLCAVADLGAFRLSELAALGAALRRCGAGAGSLESAAQGIVHLLYDELRSADQRSCALVRFYKTHPLGALDEDLQAFAKALVGDVRLSTSTPCLTLLATAGDRAEWNDRRASRQHQAVPLPSEQVVDSFPMISQLIHQFGLQVGTLVDGLDTDLIVELDEKSYNVFYVAEATGSPHIPAQDFIAEAAVRSAVGFGGMLPSGDLFAVVLFSRTPVPLATAEMFRVLALSVKLAVLPYAFGPVFAHHAGSTLETDAPSRSHVLAVDELLEVHERTVQEQSAHLEQLHALERHRSQQLDALAQAGAVLGSLPSVADILDHVTQQAREILGAHQAVGRLRFNEDWSQAITSVSMSDRYAAWRHYDGPPDGSGIHALVCETNRPVRLTQAELEAHPRWRGFGASAGQHPPTNGWLAVPLIGRGGDNIGLVQLSDARSGSFTAEDEVIFVQLAQLASISIENARGYAREHEIATALQQSLLPAIEKMPHLSVASRYLPAAQALGLGGDWFDAVPLSDGRVALVVGDVVGHDLRASRTMGQLRHAIRAYAIEDPTPASVLSRLDRLMGHLAPEEFATVLYLLLDPRTGQVCCTNAGHPPPLLLEPDGTPDYWPTTAHPPVGYLPPWHYEQDIFFLPASATLLLYTDGLIERRSASLQQGLDNLSRTTARLPHSPEGLLAALEDDLATQGLDDDVAMLAVRRAQRL